LAAFLGTKQVKGIITKVFNDPEYSPKALDALKAQGAFSPEMQKKKKEEEISNAVSGFIPNFVSQKYILNTLARIKAGTSGFSKQEQETFLNKFGAKSTGKKISLREVYDKLDGEVGIAQLIDKAYSAAGLTASNEEVYKIFEKQTKANPYPLRSLVSKKGFVPNFADPLKEAIGREMSAGVPASQIYVDQNSSLKNSMNPMGLMVANRRDEPSGGMQGINRARKEGANPMLYGAAGGFVPNYANLSSAVSSSTGIGIAKGGGVDQALKEFSKNTMQADADMKKLSAELKNKIQSLVNDKAVTQQLTEAAKQEVAIRKTLVSTKQSSIAQSILENQSNKKIAAQLDKIYIEYNKSQKSAADLDAAQKKAAAILQKTNLSQASQRAVVSSTAGLAESRSSASPESKGSRDLLGTIFAVQAGLSLLTGATEGATNEFAKYTNIISGGIGTATTTLFAFQGLSSALPKFAGFLGPAGIAVSAATAAFQIGKGVFLELSGANKRAADASKTLAIAAEKAALTLDELGASDKQDVERTVEDIIQKLNININEAELPELKKAISAGLLGTSRTNVENVLKANLEKQNNLVQTGTNLVQTGTTIFEQATYTTESSLGGKITNAVNKLADLSVTGQGAVLTKDFLPLATKAQSPEELRTLLNSELGKNLKDFKLSEGLIKEIFDPEALLKAENQLKQLKASSDPEKLKLLTKEGKSPYDWMNQPSSQLIPEQASELTTFLEEVSISYPQALDLIKKINEAREQQLKLKAEGEAGDSLGSSRQLQETIRNIQIEKNLRNKLFQQTNKANNAQIAADSDIANIKSDITLSELERNKLIGRRQFQLEKDLAILENQKSEMTEIATLAKQISAESRGVALGDKVAASLQAENAIKALSGQNISETTNVREMLEGIVEIDLIKDDADLQKILTAALKIQDAATKTTEEFNQQNNFKERGLSLAEAEAKVNENNSRVFERMQNSLSAMADDRSILARRLGYQSQMVDAEKDLKLAQFEKSSLGMSSSEKIAGQRAIERETFNKQLEINTRKSIVEAEADYIRNSKIQDNIQALQDNNTALKENTNALLKIVPTAGEPQGLNRASFITGGNLQTGAQIAPIVPKGSNIPTVNIPYDGRNAANRYNNPGGAYPRKDLLQFGLEGQGIIGGGHPIGKYPSVAHGAAANMAHFSYLNPVGKTVGQARNQWVTGKSSGFMPLGGMDSNRVISPNDLNNPSFMKQWMRATAQAEGFQGGLSEADLDAAYNFYQSNKAPNVNLGGGFSAAPSNVKMVSPEEQMKKARELASLGTAQEIYAAAQKYTSELKLQGDASNTIAENIKNFALRIKEVGEEKAAAEMLENMNRSAQDMRDAIKSIAELEKGDLETQLKDLKESPITFKEGMENGFLSLKVEQAQFAYNLGKEIPKMFSDGISGAIMSAIEGTASLKDALRSAAYEFLKAINQKMIGNLADQFVSGIGNFAMGFSNGGSVPKYASGGMINGGSGSKDDVPAMLMGGEYVVNKKSVQKYGPEFLHAINSGKLGGYAKGGAVQSGTDGFYTPGTYGQGGIQGREDLLAFAKQGYTSGQYDVIRSGEGYASINLEAESQRLTNFGRMNGPQAEALRQAKEESLGLYLQDLEAEKQRKKQQKELDKQYKEQRKQMLIQIGLAVASSVAGSMGGAGASGAKAGWAANAGKGFTTQLGGAAKGFFTGAQIGGVGPNVGGLGNWFTGVGKGLIGNFTEAGNYFKLSQIGSIDQLSQAYKAGSPNFTGFLDKTGFEYAPRATIVPESNNGIMNMFGLFENKNMRMATGGAIPSTTGIDTVPAMLSGGEFIMNRAASQNIGAGNLQALNAGAGSLPTEEKTEELNDKLVAKLDELIEVMTEGGGASGSITINVDSNGKSTEETSGESSESKQRLAKQIKDTVMKVIEQEKRLGGKLRKGLN
jgi:hypothetical protein